MPVCDDPAMQIVVKLRDLTAASSLPLISSMEEKRRISALRWLVVVAGTAAALAWIAAHLQTLFGTQNGLVRCVLTLLFSFLIVIRPKNKGDVLSISAWFSAVAAVAGMAAMLIGIVIRIQHLEWVGLLTLLFGCLSWSLPATFSRDLLRGLFVLYWAIPLPNQFFLFLQGAMQRISVNGSEWFLHIVNARVWADNLILHTGANVYEVPASCSGMRTATTVFILAAALGILRRLRWFETVVVVALSLFHALALNVLRISAMVVLAPKVGPGSGADYLHDTAGAIVIVGVLIVYFEIEVLRRWKQKRTAFQKELNPEKHQLLSEYPPFWRAVVRHKWLSAIFLSLVILTGVLVYRSRPYHRAMMIKDVATGLRDSGKVELAQKATDVVRALIPKDIDWRFTAIRLLLIRGKHDEVLSELEMLAELEENFLVQKKILKAYALMSLSRLDEAIAIVEKLPEKARREDPRVAMILAEMALRSNDSDKVAVHVVTASGWIPNAGRIRNLYPFLRIHHKWQAMAASHIEVPFHDPIQAMSILEAYMNLNDTPRVAEITLEAIRKWPDDPRILEPLYFMAIKREGGTWEEQFAAHLLRSIRCMESPDRLYELLYKCFDLGHPDLGWAVYRRIEEIDRNHPALPMCVAKYGHKWLSYRKRPLGIAAGWGGERVDLRPFLILGRCLPEWKSVAESVPLGDELGCGETVPFRKRQLTLAIREFEKGETGGALSVDMQYLYVSALEMAGRVDDAKSLLKRIVERNPEEKEAARIALSEIYERKAKWVMVYETLRDYLSAPSKSEPPPDLSKEGELEWPLPGTARAAAGVVQLVPLLRLVRAQLELKLGLAALCTAREATRLYPFAPQADALLAKALARHDSQEEALFLLSEPRVRHQFELDIMEAEALYETERYNEARDFCRQSLIPQIRIPPNETQRLSLPPAELEFLWHRVAIPSEAEFALNATLVQTNLATASPALKELMLLWLEAWENRCRGDLANPDRWEACGRDGLEKATALNNLTILLCREERFDEAALVARRAVDLLPESQILWRILVSLIGPDPVLLDEALNACPNDSNLWLAGLVGGTQSAMHMESKSVSPEMLDWVGASVARAVTNHQFSAAAMTRAGEYLYRGGLTNEAIALARESVEHGRGLLPAYVLGIRCALMAGDEKWSLLCTEKAIESSLHPLPMFYENLVILKLSDGEIDTDPDMINALRSLKKEDPGNPLWPQMLGYIRFARGGWEIVDALQEMDVAIKAGATNRVPYLVAAEASRLLGNYAKAADHLRRGLRHSPENLAMLNNLVFVLAHDSRTVPEALSMVPRLLLRGDDPRIQDTISFTCLRAGEFDRAEKAIAKILKMVPPGSPLWFRGRMHLADAAFRRGKVGVARATLTKTLRSSRGIENEDILAANALLGEINDAIESSEEDSFKSETPGVLE